MFGGSYMEALVADSVVLVLDSASLVVVAVYTVVFVALAGRG